ncbi:hypothetical protein IW261DRAFT_1487810 [Armillaria novae-zelandiae]|uniref:F-box domain-containing protein n=1 Tax=Armillaria novae-zelandiae TaxID=153914 RepID=A0AA39U3W5_9AGAR|nr:hypothetical protein IW261DRAFT_1487810 [Armillaria novae-zelandiae]
MHVRRVQTQLQVINPGFYKRPTTSIKPRQRQKWTPAPLLPTMTMGLCSSPFPLEIIHLVLEQLRTQNDLTALSYCSLVCRSWVEVSRSQLFYSMILDIGPPAICGGIISSSKRVEFLRNNPHLSGNIRHLSIVTSISSPPSSQANLICVVLPLLLRLNHLSFDLNLDLWVFPPASNAIVAILRHGTINALDLTSIHFIHYEDFFSLLYATKIKSLQLESISFAVDHTVRNKESTPSIVRRSENLARTVTLHNLSISVDVTTSVSLLKTFLREDSPLDVSRLRSLSVLSPYRTKGKYDSHHLVGSVLPELLDINRPTLRDVEVEGALSDVLFKSINARSVQILHLHSGKDLSGWLSWLIDSFSDASASRSSSLTKLMIRVSDAYPGSAKDIPKYCSPLFLAFDRLLCERFPSIVSVSVRLRWSVVADLQELFPGLYKMGKLRV